jgi:DNA polymerase IIIc chi subunit
VGFYLLSDSEPRAALKTACRLAEEAYDQGLKVVVRTDSSAATAQLDDLL